MDKGSSNINGLLPNYTTSNGGYFRVLVTSPNGCTRKSAKTQVTVVNCLRETNLESAVDFKILQVPFTNSLDLQLGAVESDQFNVTVADAQGRIVFKQAIHSNEGSETISINSQNWAEGFYYVNINSNSGSKTAKVVKIK
ncbi:MAG: T9SS type A sorting domain-containing protein [Bacteroidetes bacterium]|nr:T9SS type A sorting domain-containing protein [Bacteroidota bacterium]